MEFISLQCVVCEFMCMMVTKDDYVVVDNVGEVDGPLACENVTISNFGHGE